MGRVRRRGIGHEREGGGAVLLIVLVVALMSVGGWVAAYAGADGRVPRGTTIAGVSVGGYTRYEAVKRLADGVATELRAPMTVTVGTVTTQVTAAQAGLTVDSVDSIAGALGRRSWDPRRLWGYYTGGTDVTPVVDVDQGAMDALLDGLDQQAGQPVVDGGIAFTRGQLALTQPQQGAQLDHDEAQAAIVAAWSSGRHDVTLPLVLTPPDIDQGDLDAAVSAIGNPALSAPVTLTFAGSQVTLEPHDYARFLSVVPQNGALALQVDQDGLAALVHPDQQDVAPQDAVVALVNGAPAVTPSTDGQSYDAPGVAAALAQAVVASGAGRTVAVAGTTVPAGWTTDDANGLGITQNVATFTVSASGPGLAAGVAKLTGTVLKPGDTFSFDGTVGDLGDPASADRLATATWNAGFLAGLTDVARTAPTTWAPDEPQGRDVSVATGDLQLRNDTDHGMLLSAHVDGSNVTVDVYSTKEYDVTATVGAPYAPVPRTTTTSTDPACVAAPGSDGFSVDLVRVVTGLDGTPVRSDTVTTTYQPTDAVVCAVAPPA